MDQQLRELLHEIETHGKENDARISDRPRMMLNLEPATAQLLSILVRASGVTRGFEVGTSNAYSTIWLAWSLAPAGGRLISIDRNPDKHVLARENLRRANLLDRVELRHGRRRRNRAPACRAIRSGVPGRGSQEISGNHGIRTAQAGSKGAGHRR